MKIDVRIAYEPGAKLGQDYNRIFRETAHDWVLLVDHDVLILNPHWYLLCQKAIEQHPTAGLFTCYTNNIGGPDQKAPNPPVKDASILAHRDYAHALFDQHGYSCAPIDGAKCSGMLMLISKAAWSKVGGFPGKGMFREDWTFGRKLKAARIPVMRMNGLYVYHLRDRSVGTWIPGELTSKEIRDSVMSK